MRISSNLLRVWYSVETIGIDESGLLKNNFDVELKEGIVRDFFISMGKSEEERSLAVLCGPQDQKFKVYFTTYSKKEMEDGRSERKSVAVDVETKTKLNEKQVDLLPASISTVQLRDRSVEGPSTPSGFMVFVPSIALIGEATNQVQNCRVVLNAWRSSVEGGALKLTPVKCQFKCSQKIGDEKTCKGLCSASSGSCKACKSGGCQICKDSGECCQPFTFQVLGNKKVLELRGAGSKSENIFFKNNDMNLCLWLGSVSVLIIFKITNLLSTKELEYSIVGYNLAGDPSQVDIDRLESQEPKESSSYTKFTPVLFETFTEIETPAKVLTNVIQYYSKQLNSLQILNFEN